MPENGDARDSVRVPNAARVSVRVPNGARVSKSESGATSEELDPKWQKILEQQAKAKQERKAGQRRRASRRAEDKPESYKLPEIVIVQNGGGGRRRLG